MPRDLDPIAQLFGSVGSAPDAGFRRVPTSEKTAQREVSSKYDICRRPISVECCLYVTHSGIDALEQAGIRDLFDLGTEVSASRFANSGAGEGDAEGRHVGADEALRILEKHEKRWEGAGSEGRKHKSLEGEAADQVTTHHVLQLSSRAVRQEGPSSSRCSQIEAHLGFVNERKPQLRDSRPELPNSERPSSRRRRRRQDRGAATEGGCHLEESHESDRTDTALRKKKGEGAHMSSRSERRGGLELTTDDQQSARQRAAQQRAAFSNRCSTSARDSTQERRRQHSALVSPRDRRESSLRIAPITPTVMVDGGGASSDGQAETNTNMGQRGGEGSKYGAGGPEIKAGRRNATEIAVADVVVVKQKSAATAGEEQVRAGVRHCLARF